MESASVSEPFGLSVDTRVCFSDHKGKYKKGIEKRQTRFLAKAAPLLKQLLQRDEKILVALTACSPMSVLEQLTTGWVIYYLKRCLLVVTDRRILQLATKSDLTPRLSIAEIAHGDVAGATVASFLSRSLKFRYRNGKTESFQQLDSRTTAKLKSLLPTFVGNGAQSPAGGRRHLCPRCFSPLAAAYRCADCFLEFKTPAAALKYSILFPGGGYFYTGHPILGILDALVEFGLLVGVLVALVGVARGEQLDESLGTLLVFGMLLVFEKLISVFHARHYVKEYLPAERELAAAPTNA